MDIDWKGALDADAEALPKLIERAEAGDYEAALVLAFRVEALREGGVNRDTAIDQVANQSDDLSPDGLSFDTVLNAYKQYGALFQDPSKKRRPQVK